MPLLFWLDVVAYGISAVIAIALVLMVLGSGPQRALNRLFALFVLIAAAWAALAMLLRLTLWLQRGNPTLVAECSALAFILLGPVMLVFTARYVDRRTRWTDGMAALGVMLSVAMAFPLFSHLLVSGHRLGSTGTTHHELSTAGLVFSIVPFLYMIWSLVLFWQERRRKGEPHLALGVLVFVAGMIVGGMLDIPFPVLSFTTLLGVSILGYGVVSRQLFNPLKERTAELQQEVTERARVEEELHAQREAEREFSRRLAELHRVSLELSLADSVDDMCRLAVELGRDLLQIDRIGIWFVDRQDPAYMLGTFGVDEQGQIRDERGRRVLISLDGPHDAFLAGQVSLLYQPDDDLYDDKSEMVGRGDKALAALWDGEEVIGLISVDNFFTYRSITERQRDLFVLFAQVVGHLSSLKRAEEALRESEEMLRLIFENAFDGISVYEEFPEEGIRRLIDCNARYAEITGRSRQELLDMGNTLPIQRSIELPEGREDFLKALDQDGFYRGRFSWVRPDGKENTVEYAAVPVQIRGKTLIVGIDRDITERQRSEAEIMRLQHLLQNITDSMPSALITLAPDGRVLACNPAAEALFGKTADKSEGGVLWDTCPELARYQDLFEQVLRERQVARRHRDRMVTPGGDVYRDVDMFPLEANDIEGVVLRIDDVTRRVQLEEMMLQSAKMASVGALAAGVAHEINNPLGAMMQSAQVLQMALDVDRPRTRERLQSYAVDPEGLAHYLQERGLIEYLQGIRDMGTRAAKIVTDLLSFSRKQSSDVAPHDLNVLVQQTLDLASADYDLRRKYDFREIEVTLDLAHDLPQLICDGQQIEQVVLNLLRNAAQAMAGEQEGERQPRLTVRTRVLGEWVRLEMEDNGPGIPGEVRERLFEPFFTTKEVGKGTGLGLWLCWSIVVERHGGRIWVESGADGGSCFVIELPVVGND
jgi:PAS domain S-box-containing protein